MKTPLLSRLAAGKTFTRVSYGLCTAWNALALRLPGAKKRAARNRAAHGRTRVTGPVNGQRLPPASLLPYGRHSMDYNGCEVIACHNALLALDLPSTLAETAAYFEGRGIFLGGFFGTHVGAIPRFFRDRGVAARTRYASDTRSPEELDTLFDGARAAVFCFWNDARRLRRGIHTVALAHGPEGGLWIYNLGGEDPAPNQMYPNIAAFVRKTGALPILLVSLP